MKEKFIISLILQLSSHLISIFASYLLLLNMDVGLMGIWAYLASVLNLGFLFFDLGFNTIHFQYSGKTNYNEYFGTFFTIKIFLISINICTTLLLITIFQLWNSSYIIYILILFFSWIIIKFTDVFKRNLKSKKKIFKSEVPSFVIIFGQNIATIYLALNLSSINDPLLFLSIITLIFNSLLIIVIIIISKNDLKIVKPRKKFALSYLKDTKPLIISSILHVLGVNLGNLIIYYTLGEISLAYFNIINSYIIAILLLISGSIVDLYLVYYSQFFEKNDIKSIQEITHIIEKYSSIFFLSIIIIVFLNGELIFSLFLSNYMNSLPILYILIFIPFLSGISRPYARHMISGKRQKQSAIFDTFNLSLKLILLFILIPQEFLFFRGLGLGVIGYAIVLVIPWILISIVYRIFSKKYFNINSQKNIILHILIAIVSLGVVFILKVAIFNSLFQDDLLLLIISSFVVIGIFFGILFIFRELKKKDILYFLELFKIQIYVKSMKEEFL